MHYHSKVDVWLLLLYAAAATLPLVLDLLIRCGRRRERIAYRDIVALAYSRDFRAAPALSLRRVLIRHGRWSGQLVSPQDREGFMRELQARVKLAQQGQHKQGPSKPLQSSVSKDSP